MKLNDIEFQVLVDGEPLPEYKATPDPSTKTITCFIPSQAGKEFQIRCISQRPEHLNVASRVDGQSTDGLHCFPYKSGTIQGVHIANDELVHTVFSKLILLDDENLVPDSTILGKLGTIEVDAVRSIYNGLIEQRSTPFSVPKGMGPVHEKSKKVGGHCVSFGKAIKCSRISWASMSPMYPGEGHLAKFIFQYRPEEILHAQGIIEKPNSPEPVQREPSPKTVKRSRSTALEGDKSGQEPRIKPERPSKRVKTERQDDDIIDLTNLQEDPPKLLDQSLRGTVIDLTLDD